jgi:hypothetical protein
VRVVVKEASKTGNPMRLFEGIGESAVALIVSSVAGLMAAIGSFVAVSFIGARFFWGESNYGVPLAFGPLVAVFVGIAVFVLLFRKIRSL